MSESHVDPERIAALLDGRLSSRAREVLLSEIAASESLSELYGDAAAAVHLMDDTAYVSRATAHAGHRATDNRHRWFKDTRIRSAFAIGGLAAAAIGTVMFGRFSEYARPASSPAPSDAATYAATAGMPNAPAASPPPPAIAAGGASVTLVVFGAPADGTLTVGDSVRLRASLNDANGTRIVNVVVQWASSDPARVVMRGEWAVALAPGGPVTVTARLGGLTRTVRLVVGARGAPVASDPIARLTPDELRTEVQRFVALLEARDAAELSRRLAPRAVDGSPSRDFISWVEGTQGLSADPPALGDASDEGARARVAFRVPLRWRAGGGALGDHGRKDVTFWMTLTHDGRGWHGGEVLLYGKVTP